MRLTWNLTNQVLCSLDKPRTYLMNIQWTSSESMCNLVKTRSMQVCETAAEIMSIWYGNVSVHFWPTYRFISDVLNTTHQVDVTAVLNGDVQRRRQIEWGKRRRLFDAGRSRQWHVDIVGRVEACLFIHRSRGHSWTISKKKQKCLNLRSSFNLGLDHTRQTLQVYRFVVFGSIGGLEYGKSAKS